jgi:hypothetical protein
VESLSGHWYSDASHMWGLSRLGRAATEITMHRWTATFLLLVMVVPAFGPLALAGTAAPQAMHCMRQPLGQTAQPPMHCHHGMGQSSLPQTPEASFRALDCCCPNHDCCRGLKTSEWARPAASQFSTVSLLIEPALVAPAASRGSADRIAPDSARAPPLS